MQSINRAAPTPLFMLALIGTAVACVVLGVWSLLDLDRDGAGLRVAGCAVYLATLIVTGVYHVPRNNALEATDDPRVDRLRRTVGRLEPRPHAGVTRRRRAAVAPERSSRVFSARVRGDGLAGSTLGGSRPTVQRRRLRRRTTGSRRGWPAR